MTLLGALDVPADRPRRPLTPAQLIVFAFLAAIGVGALVLALPISHGAGSVNPLDALFTATSAVCVTGLAVVDTGSACNRLGQVVIMLLIKSGGIGILRLGGVVSAGDRSPRRFP